MTYYAVFRLQKKLICDDGSPVTLADGQWYLPVFSSRSAAEFIAHNPSEIHELQGIESEGE